MEEIQNPSPPVSEIPNPTAQPAVSQQPNPTKPAGKFSIKAIVGTIIFLLLAGGAAAGYVYREPLMSLVSKPTPTQTIALTSPTPTPDPTADWISYENTQFGYTLKYDENKHSLNDFTPNGIPDSDENYWNNVVSLCKNESCELAPPGIGVRVYENPNKFNLDDWLSNSPNRPFNKNLDGLIACYETDNRTKVLNTTFQGIPSKEYHFILDAQTVKLVEEGKCKPKSLEGGGNFQYIIFEKNGNIFMINLHSYKVEEKIILDQILSTFKFTETQVLDTSIWRYVKTKFLSLKIPQDLHIINCNDEVSHIVDWAYSDGEYCDFDGEQLITLRKDNKSYSNIDEAIPKSRTSNEQVFTISDIKYFEVAGKKAASWKQIIKGVDGGSVPSGNRVEVYILPNISISFDPKVEAGIQNYLSTITLYK